MDHPAEAERGESRVGNEYANWAADVDPPLTELLRSLCFKILSGHTVQGDKGNILQYLFRETENKQRRCNTNIF